MSRDSVSSTHGDDDGGDDDWPRHETPPEGFPTTPTAFECPACGHPVAAEVGAVAQVIGCPNCGDHFVIPAEDGSTDLPEQRERESRRDRVHAEELDGLRMRQIVASRRAAVRSRTYGLIGAMLCAVGIGQMAFNASRHVRADGWRAVAVWYGVAIVAASFGLAYCVGRVVYWHRECQGSAIGEVTTEPDFSTLQDGSQVAKSLGEVRED